jgi:sugar/nucleoside kinase (ribokinase family)
MTSPPTVLTFGEALVGYASVEDNLRTATQFTRFPGGADLNVAVGLTRLGIRTIWASVLGDDAHADYLADAVDQLGIIPRVRRVSGPTALMFKAGGATGDPEVLQVRHDTAFARHADALLAPDPSRSPPLTRSAQATASPLATSRPFSPAAACKKELIKVPLSARW